MAQPRPRRIPAEFPDGLTREIDAFMCRTGYDLWWTYFNNFRLRLPGGANRSFPEDLLNKRYRNQGASKKRSALTGAQFYLLIDQLIEELGLDAAKITTLVQSQETEELHIYVILLYLRLRAEGFKHYPDLTA